MLERFVHCKNHKMVRNIELHQTKYCLQLREKATKMLKNNYILRGSVGASIAYGLLSVKGSNHILISNNQNLINQYRINPQ